MKFFLASHLGRHKYFFFLVNGHSQWCSNKNCIKYSTSLVINTDNVSMHLILNKAKITHSYTHVCWCLSIKMKNVKKPAAELLLYKSRCNLKCKSEQLKAYYYTHCIASRHLLCSSACASIFCVRSRRKEARPSDKWSHSIKGARL